MSPLECGREADVIDAIASRRWPHRADDDLRAHVASCEICTDVAAVAQAIGAEAEAAALEPLELPPASVVWFRAQARARAEAAREAARPVAVMQALGFASAAAVVSALIGVVAYWVWSRADLLNSLPSLPLVSLGTLANVDGMGIAVRGVLLAIGFWLVLAPVAVYLVAADD